MRQHIFPGTFPLEALNNKGSAGAPLLFSYHRVPVRKMSVCSPALYPPLFACKALNLFDKRITVQ
jgi:hypothetical protein